MIIDQAVCISLPKRTDRRQAFDARWQESGLGKLTDVRIHDAVDGGWKGCLLSHRAALGQAEGVTLMLEDDVVFTERCATRLAELQPPLDWELLWVGGEHMARPKPLRPDLVRPTAVTRTHAYLVRRPSLIVKLLRVLSDLDTQLGQMPVQKYALHPFEAGQDAGLSDIDGSYRQQPAFWNTPPIRTMR